MLKTFAGKTMHITEWAREHNMSYTTLVGRLRAGWPFEMAIMTPVDLTHRHSDYCDRDLCELNKMAVITADNVDILI